MSRGWSMSGLPRRPSQHPLEQPLELIRDWGDVEVSLRVSSRADRRFVAHGCIINERRGRLANRFHIAGIDNNARAALANDVGGDILGGRRKDDGTSRTKVEGKRAWDGQNT